MNEEENIQLEGTELLKEVEKMDTGDLNTAETLTPLRHRSEFNVFEDQEGENDAIVKIPHGLSTKRKRRKSFEHFDAISKLGHSTKRAPLTAPRPNIFNSQPLNLDKTKRSLLSAFSSLNSDQDESITGNIIKTNPDTINKIRTPIKEGNPKKRQAGSPVHDDDTDYKLPKLDHSLLSTKVIDNPFTKDTTAQDDLDVSEDNEELELSRIDHRNPSNTEQKQHEYQSQEQDVENVLANLIASDEDLMGAENKENDPPMAESLETPSRVTEPVALSPRTEQHSRVADDSKLLLDTTKSPYLDDSFVTESPLISHKDRSNAHILAGLEKNDDTPSKIPPYKKPSDTPYFTIKQFKAIQKEFADEISTLEKKLHEKSATIASMTLENTTHNNTITLLNGMIDSLKLQKKQLLKSNELLQYEHETYNLDINKLQDKNEVLIKERTDQLTELFKLKNFISDLETLKAQKESKINELEENLAKHKAEIETLKESIAQIDQQNLTLTQSLEEKTKIQSKVEKLVLKFEEIQQLYNSEQSKAQSLKQSLDAYSNQLNEQKSIVEALTSENLDISKENNGLKEENTSLVQVNQIISNEIQDIKGRLDNQEDLLNSENKKLAALIETKDKKAKLDESVIDGLTRGIATLKSHVLSLKEELLTQNKSLSELQEGLDDSNELLIIRKAEVDELNIELKNSKHELESSRDALVEKQKIIVKLNDELDQIKEKLSEQRELVNKLEDHLAKAENAHILELEALHRELSSLQTLASEKSNEVVQLTEDKIASKGQIDLLKYQLNEAHKETQKLKLSMSKSNNDTAAAAADVNSQVVDQLNATIVELREENKKLELNIETSLQQLAEDLYIQYSKKHEQKVAVLKQGFESKWQGKLSKSEADNEKLRREIEGLKLTLEKETAEKNHVIRLWDELVKENNNG